MFVSDIPEPLPFSSQVNSKAVVVACARTPHPLRDRRAGAMGATTEDTVEKKKRFSDVRRFKQYRYVFALYHRHKISPRVSKSSNMFELFKLYVS